MSLRHASAGLEEDRPVYCEQSFRYPKKMDGSQSPPLPYGSRRSLVASDSSDGESDVLRLSQETSPLQQVQILEDIRRRQEQDRRLRQSYYSFYLLGHHPVLLSAFAAIESLWQHLQPVSTRKKIYPTIHSRPQWKDRVFPWCRPYQECQVLFENQPGLNRQPVLPMH